MTAAEVEAYLREHIPLSIPLGVRVVRATTESVVLEAPLEPNLNHQESAFGGSVSAIAILTGWTAVHFRLHAEGHRARTVIQESHVRYDAPIRAAFRARSRAVDRPDWARFTRTLERRGKARIGVEVAIEVAAGVVAEFRGRYVALGES